jgi:adenosylmethionine-8-amino-7-oxononanoate aminotransferase
LKSVLQEDNSPPSKVEHLLQRNLVPERPIFVSGDGVELVDDKGRRYLDGSSGVGVSCLGYGVGEIVGAIEAQARTLPYVHGLRFDSLPASELAALIASLAPGDLDYVFLCSGGSEANESAFKFARQYWLEMGKPTKWRVIGRRPSFHGSTIATLSAGWHSARRRRYGPMLLPFSHIEAPNGYRGCSICRTNGGHCTLACAEDLERAILAEGPENVAAFIAEPVVGAAGGALVPQAGYFQRVREICDAYQVLLIADEVLTGFGRLGRWFGIERFGITPDIIVFAKGVSAGYQPLGGLIVRRGLAEAFRTVGSRFEHNFTMAAHPVSCAAGVAAVTILQRRGLVDRVAEVEQFFFGRLADDLRDIEIVGDIRGLGLLAGIELVRDKIRKEPFAPSDSASTKAARAAFEEGLIIYPCQGGVEGMPAITSS